MKNNILPWFIGLVAITQILWILIIPVWQNPDEITHFFYVQFIAEKHRLPLSFSDHQQTQEVIESTALLGTNETLRIPFGRPLFAEGAIGVNEEKIKNLKDQKRTFLPTKSFLQGDYPPFYYFVSALVYSLFREGDIVTRVLAVRFIGLILKILLVVFVIKIANLIKTDNLFAIALASLVGFHPELSMVFASINPDVIIFFLSVVLLYLSLKVVAQGLSYPLSIIIAFICALGIFTKQTFIPSIIIYLGLLVYDAWRYRSFKKNLIQVAIFTFSILILNLWWYLKWPAFSPIALRIGEVLPGQIMRQSIWDYAKEFYSRYTGWTLGSFWARFGWLDVYLPVFYYKIIRILSALSLIGLALRFFDWLKQRTLNYSAIIVFTFLFVFSLGIIISDYH